MSPTSVSPTGPCWDTSTDRHRSLLCQRSTVPIAERPAEHVVTAHRRLWPSRSRIRYRARPVMTHHGVLEVAGDLTALANASAAD